MAAHPPSHPVPIPKGESAVLARAIIDQGRPLTARGCHAPF